MENNAGSDVLAQETGNCPIAWQSLFSSAQDQWKNVGLPNWSDLQWVRKNGYRICDPLFPTHTSISQIRPGKQLPSSNAPPEVGYDTGNTGYSPFLQAEFQPLEILEGKRRHEEQECAFHMRSAALSRQQLAEQMWQ